MPRVVRPQFTGSAAEYFRIWIVNLLLTIVTLGIFPIIHFGLIHGKLPRNRRDDPTAGAAVVASG